jgi:hypothetical protein
LCPLLLNHAPNTASETGGYLLVSIGHCTKATFVIIQLRGLLFRE